ncbi:MAG: hypothetical protein WAW16_02065 [Candidatus Cryosericum sp.]
MERHSRGGYRCKDRCCSSVVKNGKIAQKGRTLVFLNGRQGCRCNNSQFLVGYALSM